MRQGARDYVVKPGEPRRAPRQDRRDRLTAARPDLPWPAPPRIDLRTFQQELASRLATQDGGAGRIVAAWAVVAAASSWLVRLADAGEVVTCRRS